MRPPLSLAAVVAAAAVLAGCSTTIDDEKGEAAIQKSAEKLGIDVDTVDCPAGKTAKKGDTFTCKVTAADGSTGDVRVEETDDEGNVNFDAPFVSPKTLQDGVAGTLAKQSGVAGITAECPQIVTATKGTAVDCDATGGGEDLTVTVSFDDDQGNYTLKVKR